MKCDAVRAIASMTPPDEPKICAAPVLSPSGRSNSPSSGSALKHDTDNVRFQSIDSIRQIRRAFVSTGMDVYLAQSSLLSEIEDSTIYLETEVPTREIQWRLRGVVRDIALRKMFRVAL